MALKAVRPALTHWRHSNALVPIRAECIPRYAFMPALLSEILPFSPAMPLSVRNNAQEGTLLGLDSTQPYLGYWDTTYLLQACIHAILNNNECPEPPHPFSDYGFYFICISYIYLELDSMHICTQYYVSSNETMKVSGAVKSWEWAKCNTAFKSNRIVMKRTLGK